MKSNWPLRGFLAALIAFLAACGAQSPSLQAQGTGIVGGKDADGSEPFAATLAFLEHRKFGGLCTVSLLSDSVALTAAHCIEDVPENLILVFDIAPAHKARNERIVRKIEETVVSPVWPVRADEEDNLGDIALIRFSGGLPEGYRTAKLIPNASVLKNGVTLLIAGYGETDAAKAEGLGRLRFTTTTLLQSEFTMTELLLDQSQGRGVCRGDSGGPAYIEVNGDLLVAGTTSRGVNAECTVATIFTNVAYYREWIDLTLTRFKRRATLEKKEATVSSTVAP